MALLALTTPTNPGVASWTDAFALDGSTDVVTPGTSGSFVMDENARIALVDTTAGAVILFAPLVGNGRLTVRIVAGTLPVEITPANPSQAINGTPGATYTLDPLTGDESAEFVGDVANGIWWLII